MATKDLILRQLKKLETIYSKKLTDEQIEVYLEMLEEYDFAFIWDAAQTHIKTSKFFPKPAELIGNIRDIPRHETDYCKRLNELRQRPYSFDPAEWEARAEVYDNLFSGRAESCRRRASYLEAQ